MPASHASSIDHEEFLRPKEQLTHSNSSSRSSSTSSQASSSCNGENAADLLCLQCDEPHRRRRLVICIDGTWMVPDGPIGMRTMRATLCSLTCARLLQGQRQRYLPDMVHSEGRHRTRRQRRAVATGIASFFLQKTSMSLTPVNRSEHPSSRGSALSTT